MNKLFADHLLPVMLPRVSLIAGEYYAGLCRNATIARWDGSQFHHWRRKWGYNFIETIKHPEDEGVFDAFVPIAHASPYEVRSIEFGVKLEGTK